MCSVSSLISPVTGIEAYFMVPLLKTPSRAAVHSSLSPPACSVKLCTQTSISMMSKLSGSENHVAIGDGARGCQTQE